MAKKTIKINTNPDLLKEFNIAKAELEAESSEEALALLMLRCSEADELERVDKTQLEDKIQEKHL